MGKAIKLDTYNYCKACYYIGDGFHQVRDGYCGLGECFTCANIEPDPSFQDVAIVCPKCHEYEAFYLSDWHPLLIAVD